MLILDYPRKTLSFSRSLSLPASDAQLLSYERPFRVPVTVAGLPMQANLDTGANISMVMPKSLYDKIASGPLLPAAPGRLTNTVIETQRSVLEGQVDIGGMSLSKVELHVAEKFPELLLGAHLLQKFAVLIDQRSKRIALCN